MHGEGVVQHVAVSERLRGFFEALHKIGKNLLFARFPQPAGAVSSRRALKGELLLPARNIVLLPHVPPAFRAETHELALLGQRWG